jgi:hypothetical protein
MSARRRVVVSLSAAAMAGLSVLAGSASAATPAVIKTGHCSGTSVYSLQVQRETASAISVDWGVDMRKHAKGIKWAVTEADNGTGFVKTTATTIADGSFSITRHISSQATNVISATATNPASGETCVASATL